VVRPVNDRSPPYSLLAEGMYVLADGQDFNDRPVQLVERITTPLGQSGYWWNVRCLAHNYVYKSSERMLGREISEMEALAHAMDWE